MFTQRYFQHDPTMFRPSRFEAVVCKEAMTSIVLEMCKTFYCPRITYVDRRITAARESALLSEGHRTISTRRYASPGFTEPRRVAGRVTYDSPRIPINATGSKKMPSAAR